MERIEQINAVRNRDKRYDGKFFVAVTSTKIVCRPSCSAKMPLEKNMAFYDTFEEALAELHGVTLESLVIATRAANAIRHRIERGELRAESFPLLLHCDDVINHDKPAGDIPWDAFEEDWEL